MRSRSVRSALTQPVFGYFTEAWNPPINWVSPERIALTRISAQYLIREFESYIANNASYIPNYGERWHNGEAISTGFVESTVNQVVSKRFVKKQQMRWTPKGAHLLLQVRALVLNKEWSNKFQQWYLGLTVNNEQNQPVLMTA